MRCLPPPPDEVAAGRASIRLLIVPDSVHHDDPIPSQELALGERARHEVMAYLNARRLLTSTLRIDPPEYRFVAVEVSVGARRRTSKEALARAIEQALYTFINPVHGGPDGEGWPWERNLFPSEVTSLVQRIEGVEYVESVRLLVADPATGTRLPVDGTFTCPANGLLASADHQVAVL